MFTNNIGSAKIERGVQKSDRRNGESVREPTPLSVDANAPLLLLLGVPFRRVHALRGFSMHPYRAREGVGVEAPGG